MRSSLLSFGQPDPGRRPFGDLPEGPGEARVSSDLKGLAQLGSSLGGLGRAEEESVERFEEPVQDRWSAAQVVYNDFEL